MVAAAILLGRVWCLVCPLELLANGTERLGRRLGVRQRRLSKGLRAGFAMLMSFMVIQWLIPGIGIHRVPAYTSMFLFTMLVGAAVVGFVFRDRAFCRGFCAVGLLLRTYGRGGMLAVRPTSGGPCEGCAVRDCVSPENRNRLDARSCPSLLNPARLDRNTDCLICGRGPLQTSWNTSAIPQKTHVSIDG